MGIWSWFRVHRGDGVHLDARHIVILSLVPGISNFRSSLFFLDLGGNMSNEVGEGRERLTTFEEAVFPSLIS
jgi:hypothetical protein